MGNSQSTKLGDDILMSCIKNDPSKLLQVCSKLEDLNSNLQISSSLLDKYNLSIDWNPCVLHLLVEFDKLEMLDYLSEAFDNIDLDVKDNIGFTPLILSIQKRNLNLVNSLLERGASVDLCNKYDIYDSPLHYAVNLGEFPLVELLVRWKALINSANIEGMTPLMYSCQANKTSIIEFLIENSADPIIKDSYGNSSIHYAIISGVDRSIIDFILLNCDHHCILYDKNASGETLEQLLKSYTSYSPESYMGKTTERDNAILPDMNTTFRDRDLTIDYKIV